MLNQGKSKSVFVKDGKCRKTFVIILPEETDGPIIQLLNDFPVPTGTNVLTQTITSMACMLEGPQEHVYWTGIMFCFRINLDSTYNLTTNVS